MADFKSGENPFASNADAVGSHIPSGVNPFGEQPAAPATNTLWDEAKRQTGLTGRALVSAVGSFGALPADAIGKAVNYAAGREVIPNQQRALQQTLTNIGLPVPERPIERVTQAVGESAPAFALPGAHMAQMGGNAAIAATQAQPGQELRDAALGTVFAGAPAVANIAGRAVKTAVPTVLGMTTGAGRESVEQAFKGTPEFVANMRGQVPASTVVEQARAGVANMRQQMYDRYATAKGGWAGDTTTLDFKPIADAANAAAAKFGFKGIPQPGVADVQQQVNATLANWQKQGATDPAFFTVEGLDALKRQLADIIPDNVANRTGRTYVTEVVNGVKDSITRQAPKYSAAMKDYWARSSELDEISKSLSLGNNVTTDTALRKLQSLMRNNAATNYGQRLVSADALANAGADVMPAVAGQAMSTWAPRGIQGAVAGGAGVPSALLAPETLLAAPLMSPRAVGEVAHFAGRAVNPVLNDPRTIAILNALRRGMPPAAVEATRDGNE